MITLESLPRLDGFYMPGEFEAHDGCWMLWPFRPDVWRENATPAQRVFAEVATAIARFEPVNVGVSAEQEANARAMLPDIVTIHVLDYNDAWMRDNGCTFVVDKNRNVRGIDWDFNAWGGLYKDWKADDALARKMLAYHDYHRYNAPLVMEGGAIDVDGEGTLIVTEQCLLSPTRNPSLNKDEIERFLVDYLNVSKVIWLQNGVFNDETDGHVDNLCCFVKPGVIALTWCDDPNDPQHAISAAALEILQNSTDAKGRSFEVHKLHQPNVMHISAEEAAGILDVDGSHERSESTRLAASYINFYVANGGVIVPQFNDPHDAAACATLSKLYPDREIVGIQAREILLGGGNIHCITQQIPKRRMKDEIRRLN